MDGLSPSPLIIALDHETVDDAERCVTSLAGLVERYKVGSVLYSRVGPPFVRELIDAGYSVFLDLKFHDTPATVAGAVAAAADLGVDLVTLHAAGGIEMLESARRAVDVGDSNLRLLAVTVLTSLNEEDYSRMVGPGARSLGDAATALAEMAIGSGIDGCVCAASDAARLRTALGPAPLLVVPGIRPAWSIANHSGQARTATPRAAIDAGRGQDSGRARRVSSEGTSQGREWLDQLTAIGAVTQGHFELSSGLHSPEYVQCARLLERPDLVQSAAQDLVALLSPLLDAPPVTIASPALGAITLGYEVARAWGCRSIWAEREPGDGRLAFRRGFGLQADERVVAVEDVVTTAGSLRELVELLERRNAQVVGVATLVDRSGGAVEWRVPSVALVTLEGVQVPPSRCAQCAAGLELEKPGSRPSGAGTKPT